MKNAAKCDTSCDLQNPVNHQTFERTLRSRAFLGACLSECPPKTPCPPLVFRRGAMQTYALSYAAYSTYVRRFHVKKWCCRVACNAICVYCCRITSSVTDVATALGTNFREEVGPLHVLPSIEALAVATVANSECIDLSLSVFPADAVSEMLCTTMRVHCDNNHPRTSDQARGPAEFKHITKRRKRH